MIFQYKRVATILLASLVFSSVGTLLAQPQNVSNVNTMSVLPPDPLPEALQKLQEAPIKLIGMTLQELLVSFGVPVSVTAVRGIEPWQDDIVFNYKNGLSFYIYKDRVWKLRIGSGYRQPFMGIVIGSSVDMAVTLFGLPKVQENQYTEWVMPFESWPMRLRALTDHDGKIVALFLYRSDI
ncbi:MAG TPA: hypothetical protein P5519_05880 [Spirochaetia bacterium]|nr:hypothetical protein [Spirochaetales bacterium]HRS65401.1 hypothetical protein [Spirochaetia bacterium]HOT58119.1 hypothetical protein [Spirochaetales bacterium]HPD80404.1 hypothetical protein [Spirochaetales bacterium]HQK33198.1 hypothetical protein [Spirochaetales bacterium]